MAVEFVNAGMIHYGHRQWGRLWFYPLIFGIGRVLVGGVVIS